RYRFHDLVKIFAMECLATDEPEEENRSTLLRLAEWYINQCEGADALFHPVRRRRAIRELPQPTDATATISEHEVLLQTVAWFDSEQANALAILTRVYTLGFWEATWRLAVSLHQYLGLRSLWRERRSSQEIALAAANTALLMRVDHGAGSRSG